MKVRYLLIAAVFVGMIVGLEPMISKVAQADINGDGTDEIGAFAVETSGAARGNWFQVWEANGTNLASVFLLPDFSNFRFKNIDVNGNGAEELVLLAVRNSDGAVLIQVRASTGVLVGSAFVPGGSTYTNHQLFKVNWNGGAAQEIGVGFTRASDGVGFFQVYTFTPGTGSGLTLAHGTSFTGPGLGSRQWKAADFDNDGSEDIFVGFQRLSDGTGGYSVYSRVSGALGGAFVGGPGFTNHQWVLGDFNAGTGAEVLVGFIRASDGFAAFQVRNEAGTNLGGAFVTGSAFGGHEWRSISAGASDLVFVGFVRNSDGVPAYHVWNPATSSKVSGRFIIGTGFSIAEWFTGNFDSNGGNGQEVGVGFVRDSDGAIAFQTWSRSGATRHGAAFALPGTFVNPSFISLNPFTLARDDIMIGAANTSGAPVVKLYQPNGTQAFAKFIFNNDVI